MKAWMCGDGVSTSEAKLLIYFTLTLATGFQSLIKRPTVSLINVSVKMTENCAEIESIFQKIGFSSSIVFLKPFTYKVDILRLH